MKSLYRFLCLFLVATLVGCDGGGGSTNSNPTINSFTSTVSDSNPLQVTFNWSVSDADGDPVSCVFAPGSNLSQTDISDCLTTTSKTVTYTEEGDHTASLSASDGQGSSTSNNVNFTVFAPPTEESTVTMSGSVTTFSDTDTVEAKNIVRRLEVPVTQYKQLITTRVNDVAGSENRSAATTGGSTRLELDREWAAHATATASGSITSVDLVPVSALVSLFLLSDVNYENPIATVPTDEFGNYKITVADVTPYLLSQGLEESSTEQEIINAFRALGKLQVRALIVKEKDGQKKALAIQSIADPADVDETTGEPKPVAVNPIVHRITKSITDQVKKSIESLKELGVTDELIEELAKSVIAAVASEIDRVLTEAVNTEILIPEGQSLADVIESQEREFELNLPEDKVGSLTNVISGTTKVDSETINVLKDGVLNAGEVIGSADSSLKASLDSESQGLLANLGTAFNDEVVVEFDARVNEAEKTGTLSQIFQIAQGETEEQAKAMAEVEKKLLLKRSLQQFFLSMGLTVIVDENDQGNARVVAVNLPVPVHLEDKDLPGGKGFGDRNIRLFKLGEGELGPNYTTDKSAPLGVIVDGIPQPPLYYTPPLADVVSTQLLPSGQTLETFQKQLDEAFNRLLDPDAPLVPADFNLIEQVSVFHELSWILQHTNLVSAKVIDKLVEHNDSTIKIKRLAAVIAENFTWANEAVNLTPEGFPIFSDRLMPLTVKTVDSSELVKALSFTLGTSAKETARLLTQRESFYAPFAPDAVQAAIQRAQFQQGANFDLTQSLLDIYPEMAAGYRDIILGTASGVPPAPAYEIARDRIARGLIAAVPATLFGQTLTSESAVKIRSALFFTDYLLERSFRIDPSRGYFTEFTITDRQGSLHTRWVPNFDNFKLMVAKSNVTITTLISKLLNITPIDNGESFAAAEEKLLNGLSGLPVLPEFKEQNIGDFDNDLASRRDAVSVSCTVQRYDGVDPAAGGNAQSELNLSVFAVEDAITGQFNIGAEIDLTGKLSSQLLEGPGPIKRTYTIANLDTLDGGEYGRDYVIHFGIAGYQNELPELHFYADGFVPHLNLCDPHAPLMIGPDHQFVPVPGLGVVSDQHRPGAFGQPDQAEGIDVSNFEQPGAPIFLTAQEEEQGLGAVDFLFASTASGYALKAAKTDSKVAFAPLFGGYTNQGLTLSLSSAGGALDPLYGLFSIMGADVRAAIEAAVADPDLLSTSIALDADTFEPDRLYLMRDRGGRYWILELRLLDQFAEFDGRQMAFLDFGLARIDNLGKVVVPKAAFDPVPTTVDDGQQVATEHYRLHYGDWLILDNPSQYGGPDWLPPEEVAFEDHTDEYDQLEMATDGVFFRYAGEHFEENITSRDDFATVFGEPPDYSSIPVRIDSSHPGVVFIKLSFNKQLQKYVINVPDLESATGYVSNLQHNDIIAVFDVNSENPDVPFYLARVIRDLPPNDPQANFEIGLDVVPFGNQTGEQSDADVVCFVEDGLPCPQEYPGLVYSSDLSTSEGIVYDADFDGVPALFDPNDHDPNIPGQLPSPDFNKDLFISLLAESDGQSGVNKSFLVETRNVYPGDIQAVALTSPIFGETAGQQVIFTCVPPTVDGNGNFTDYQCSSLSVAGGVTVDFRGKIGDIAAFQLTVPDETLAVLGTRVDFEYAISFRVPTDVDGNPVQCGTAACPALPPVKGKVSVSVPDSLNVLDDLTVAIGSDAPTRFSGVSTNKLDVSRPLVFTGAKIPGAKEYELNVFCPGSKPGEPFRPEENLLFFAPARDALGNTIQPKFTLDIPWISGRSCDITLTAFLYNAAGSFIGVSALRFEDVVTDTGGAIHNNELKLAAGQKVCLDADNKPSTAGCTEENTLFAVNAFNVDGDKPVAEVALGSAVTNASVDGHRVELTSGYLMAGSLVGFNVDLEVPPEAITPPSCGWISTDSASNYCGPEGPLDAMTDIFEVNADFTELSLIDSLPLPMEIHGVVTESGAISLEQPGFDFFEVVDSQTGETLLEIGIDIYQDASGGKEVWSNFTLTAGQSEYHGEGDNTLQLTAPGFMRVLHNSGQPVDFDVYYVGQDLLKLRWFLPPAPKVLPGEYDVNGDGETDVSASYDAGNWTFLFSGSVLTNVEQHKEFGTECIAANEDGSYTVTVAEEAGVGDFDLHFDTGQYAFIAEFKTEGTGEVVWFDFFAPESGAFNCSTGQEPEFEFSVGDEGAAALYFDEMAGLNRDGIGTLLLSVGVDSSTLTVMLSEDAQGINLNTIGQTGNVLNFTRGQNVPFVFDYNDENGSDWRFEVIDTGLEVEFRVFSVDGDLPPPPPPPLDTDGDGVGDLSDNCPHLANADQTDLNSNGVGDACERSFDLSNVYHVYSTLAGVTGSDLDCGYIPLGTTFSHVENWKQWGSSVTALVSNYYPRQGIHSGSVDENGNIALELVSETPHFLHNFSLNATYDAVTGVITGTSTVTFGEEDEGGVFNQVCSETFAVTAAPFLPVAADEALAGGIFSVAELDFDLKYEEIVLNGSTIDKIDYWFDRDLGQWTADSTDLMLGSAGWQDVADTETLEAIDPEKGSATIARTVDGITYERYQVGIRNRDVGGQLQWSLLPITWQANVAPPLDLTATFSQGAKIMETTLVTQQESYEVACDYSLESLKLDCWVPIGEEEAVFEGQTAKTAIEPIVAQSLEQLLTPVGAEEVRIRVGHRPGLFMVLHGTDASPGSSGIVEFTLINDDGDRISLGETPWRVESVHGETLMLLDIPKEIGELSSRNEEDLNMLFAVIPDASSGKNYVREGRRIAQGEVFHKWKLFNGVAFTDVINNFDFSGNGEPPNFFFCNPLIPNMDQPGCIELPSTPLPPEAPPCDPLIPLKDQYGCLEPE